MSRLVYFFVTIAAVALLVSIPASGMAGAMPDSEWSVPMVADAGVEGSNAELEFGIDSDGTDGYDSGIDLLSPPPGPGALFEAYFSIVHTLFPRLNKDLRGEVPNEWTLKMRSTDENIELWWNTADVPQGVSLTLVSGEAEIDMKAVNGITLPAGAHTITIVAEQIERIQYDLTISSTDGGSVTIPGEGTFAYDDGTVVNLISEAREGYRFVNWTGDVDTIVNVNVASTTVTMNDNYYITANFAVIPPGQYSLAISSTNGGSVTVPGEGTFVYDEGTVVSLVAEAEEGYRFVTWNGDVETIADVEAATTAITVQGDYNIRAGFAAPAVQYDLTVSSTAGGAIIAPGEGTFAYDEGTTVALVAEAQEGHQFASWTGDVETIADFEAASTTISMQGNYTVRASFADIPPPTNWRLIGGVIAVVVVVGLGIFFFRRGRVA